MKKLRDVPLRYRVASLLFGVMSLFLFGVVFALVRQADRAAANQAWAWVAIAALIALIAAAGAGCGLVAWGALSDPKSRLGDWVQKRPLVDAVHYAAGDAFVWGGFFLIYLAGSYDILMGVAVLFCWVLTLVLIVRRELKLEAVDDPDDSRRANRLIVSRAGGRQLKPPGKRHIVLRFVIEFLKCIAIIIALPLGIGGAAEFVELALSDRDVNGAYASGMAGLAAGALGLIIAMVIVATRIADIED